MEGKAVFLIETNIPKRLPVVDVGLYYNGDSATDHGSNNQAFGIIIGKVCFNTNL